MKEVVIKYILKNNVDLYHRLTHTRIVAFLQNKFPNRTIETLRQDAYTGLKQCKDM